MQCGVQGYVGRAVLLRPPSLPSGQVGYILAWVMMHKKVKYFRSLANQAICLGSIYAFRQVFPMFVHYLSS